MIDCMLNLSLIYCGSIAAARALTMALSMTQHNVSSIVPSRSLIDLSGRTIVSSCECLSVSHTAVAHNNNNSCKENG